MVNSKLSNVLKLAFILSMSACSDEALKNLPPLDGIELDQSPTAVLGKLIFEDKRLSEPQGMSCASCHVKELAFTGNNNSAIPAVSAGIVPGRYGNRNAPSVYYAAYSPAFGFIDANGRGGPNTVIPIGGQFRDGRATSLSEQAKGPFLNPLEMNNPSKQAVIEKIMNGPYAVVFKAVYGQNAFADVDTAYQYVADAIAAAEDTAKFSPFNSKFDAVLRGEAQFTPQEAQGFAVFRDPQKGNCMACHTGSPGSSNPADWLFTNFGYDNLGVPRNNDIPDNRDPSFFDLGLCNQPGLANRTPQGFNIRTSCGSFKTPSLRNVALTGPYMHNGVFQTLESVVGFYATRDTNPEIWYPGGRDGRTYKFNDLPEVYHANVNTAVAPYDRRPGQAPRYNRAEADAIVAFLRTLTDK